MNKLNNSRRKNKFWVTITIVWLPI